MPDIGNILEPFLDQLCRHAVAVVVIAVLIGLATGLFVRGAHQSLLRFRYRFLGMVPKTGRRHAYRRGQGARQH